MFNGIVECVGKITALHQSNQCLTFQVKPSEKFLDVRVGDSIAINGVCLTVTELTADYFMFTAVPETLRLTNLGLIRMGDQVNLERALASNARISGHYMQGHVDFTGEILEINPDGDKALLVKISHPENYAKYIVKKGYIGLDGMSITIVESTPGWFTVTFIPHTQAVTIVKQYQVGSKINIEVDIFGKYVEKMLEAHYASH